MSRDATGFIGRLVDYLPGGASLWFTCRSLPDLPLARWKAVLLATELGEDDLAFTPEEVRGFCRDILAIDLDVPASELLHRASSGWVTGLIPLRESRPGQDLAEAAQVLRRAVSPRPHAYAPAPGGGAGPGAVTVTSLYQYMAAEILRGVHPELQRFLLQSAVLPFLSMDAWAAVAGTEATGDARSETGKVAGDTGRLMDEAVVRTPLVFRLGEGRYVYHPMLRAFLLDRLSETAGRSHVVMLYLRAGDFLASQGWRAEGLDCYARAEAWEHGRAFVRSGCINALEAWVGPLRRKILHGDPELLALLGAVRRAQGRSEEALALW